MVVSPPPVSSPGWNSRTKTLVALVCLVVVAIILWRVTDALPIVVISLVLSYLLNPLATFLDHRVLGGKRRSIAILLTFVIAIALLVILVLIVLPVIVSQLRAFGEQLPGLIANFESEVERVLSQPITIGDQRFVPLDSLRAALGTNEQGDATAAGDFSLSGTVTQFFTSLTGPAFTFVGRAFGLVINLVLLLTMMFYLLKDGGVFVSNIVGIVPPTYQSDARRLVYELSQVWNAYLRGQLILCLAMGLLTYFAALLLGVPNAPILGLLSGVLEFVPTIGPAIALVPAVLLALASTSATLPFLEGVPFALVVAVVWTALQNIEAVLLVPRIMGDSLNLHPFVVIIGVIFGASLAGILGVLLAAPVLSSVRVIGQYLYGKLTDKDPFPPPDPRDIRQAWQSSLGHRLALGVRFVRVQFNRLFERTP